MSVLLGQKSSRSLLLVSGGPDSVFLFLQFLKRGKLFAVLHFDHGLRIPDSKRDAEFVQDLCRRHNIECFVVQLSFDSKRDLQNQARQKRLNEACRLAKTKGFDNLVLAHHQDDQIETLIMKHARGSGLKGLAGIRSRATYKGMKLIRPLLTLSKTKILRELKFLGQNFCEDASNTSAVYFRNRVRLQLQKKPLNKDVTQNILTEQKFLTALDAYFSARVRQLNARYAHSIPRATWKNLNDEIAFRLSRSLAKRCGFKNEWQKHHLETLKKNNFVLKSGNAEIGGDKTTLWFVSKQWLKNSTRPLSIPKPGAYFWGFFKIKVIVKKTIYKSLKNKEFLIKKNQNWPLQMCCAQNGNEPFLAFGRKSAKPLKRVLQDFGVGQYTRRFWPVLKDAHNRIVAVPGADIADDMKLKEANETCLQLSFKRRRQPAKAQWEDMSCSNLVSD